jgi:hypothetical protein
MHVRSHLWVTAGAAPNWGSLASAQHWGLGAGTRIQYRVISNLAPPVALCTKWLHYGFSSEAYILTNCGGVDAVRIAVLTAY